MGTNHYWSSGPLSELTAPEHHWLFLPGALTPRLKAMGDYSIEVIEQSHTLLNHDEAEALDVPPASTGWVREVVMKIDGEACVTARSLTSVPALSADWAELNGYGGRPLAEILYRSEQTLREPFQCALLSPGAPLAALSYRYAPHAKRLLARRSRFTRNGSALLVSECFLPAFWARV
ncbi:chorismate lyase [Pseudomonas sp. ANT_J12]|jgi:chorismate--pyruvate lyase|uniref:chorismate--pyruvate lyase family protein n=1 Tax=Pseudomonas sp. ANT_J12 TaxID=2597351 RepID=UPI0011F23063|nr:chorismate lyase [Pseudomonas sp. ANT_J12]KAA0997245.1 chorismate lyase [Pseudomonas sp. ANT_J12]